MRIQLEDFNADPVFRHVPTISNITLSKVKNNRAFTLKTKELVCFLCQFLQYCK